MGTRKRIRLLFRVLQKNAKIQNAQSCFTKMPTSEAMHVVHSWFLDTFGEANRKIETTKLNSRKTGKSKARISMSNINLQKCLSQKYV